MAKIVFKGMTYNNEYAMPYDVRQEYMKEKKQRTEGSAASKSLSDIVDMSPEIKAIYERARGEVDNRLPSSQRTQELPKTEDIYRQSAPEDMKHLPTDESMYRPSQPLIDPDKSAIEPESAFGMSRFISSVVWALILVAVAFIVMRFLL